MFTQSSRYYDALYALKDYGAATDRLVAILEEHRRGARILLRGGRGRGHQVDFLQHARSMGRRSRERRSSAETEAPSPIRRFPTLTLQPA